MRVAADKLTSGFGLWQGGHVQSAEEAPHAIESFQSQLLETFVS